MKTIFKTIAVILLEIWNRILILSVCMLLLVASIISPKWLLQAIETAGNNIKTIRTKE